MAILRKIYPFLLLLLLTSCEEVISIDMPHKPVMSVNTLLTAGEPIDVSVAKSRLYTDTAANASVVDVAIVNIYANGELQSESYIPKEGDEIRVEAESRSLGQASATVTIPHAVPPSDISWETSDVRVYRHIYGNIEENNYYYDIDFKLRVKLTIPDPPGENFYKITFENPSDTCKDDFCLMISSFQYNNEPIFGEHIGIFESLMGSDAYGYTFFTDRQFDGNNYTLNLQFDLCNYTGLSKDLPETKFAINVFAISQSYYNWANYIWQRDNGTLADLGDFGFGDQVWGYSNVSTGAGVVAAQSRYVCTVDLHEFIKDITTKEYEY